MSSPNWAEQVTAIATAVGALGLLGAIGAALFAGQQVREERKTRQATVAADLFRRWDEEPLVETRRFVAQFADGEELAAAFRRYLSTNAPEVYVLYRELDFFEQLSALEVTGAIDFDLIELMLGPTLVERWELWRPSIEAIARDHPYPDFEALAEKMRTTLHGAARGADRAG